MRSGESGRRPWAPQRGGGAGQGSELRLRESGDPPGGSGAARSSERLLLPSAAAASSAPSERGGVAIRFPGAPHPPPLTAFPSAAAAVGPAGLCLRLTRRGTPPSPPALCTPDLIPGEYHLPTPPTPGRCAPSSRAGGASYPSSCAALTDTRGGQWGGAEGPGASSYWPREEEEPGLEVGVRDPAVRSARLGAAARGSILRRQQPRPRADGGARRGQAQPLRRPAPRLGGSTGSGGGPPLRRPPGSGPPEARRGGATEPAAGRAGRGGRPGPGPGGGRGKGSPGHAAPPLKPPRHSPQPPGPAMAAPL